MKALKTLPFFFFVFLFIFVLTVFLLIFIFTFSSIPLIIHLFHLRLSD
jgi:hypothetical protein